MNKVICDICGTSYPDTATSCPICGFERDQKLSVLDEDVLVEPEVAEEVPVAVKGGRFSHSNVRKRNNGAESEGASSYEEEYDDAYEEAPEKQPKKESNTALIVVLVLLLAAIVAVIVYIYTSFFAPHGDENPQGTTTEPQTSTTQNNSTPPAEIPCTNLTVSETVITLDAIGNAWLLNVIPEPANTTDTITYTSSDEAVAKVNESGRITAVGAGTATVTVTCGDKVVTCNVTCTVAAGTTAPGTEPTTEPTTAPTTAPTTEPTTAPTTAPTEPARAWKLNRTEITFSDKYPTPWMLYEGTISKANVTFSSDDERVATFINGLVTPVGNGKTVVRATYNGETLTCTVWVNFKTTTTEPSDPTDPSSSATSESTTAATTDGTTAATTDGTTAATTESTTAATTESTTAATTEATTAATTEATTAATTEATTATTEGVG